MDALRGAAVIAHGGGPTPVLNASLAGAVVEAQRHDEITEFFGARRGASGLLNGDLIDLFAQGTSTLERIAHAPGSALGSSRRSIEAADYERMLDVFRKYNVRYFFYTGGNGSMGTAADIVDCARQANYDMRVIGIPKTIDNDLHGTDHTPGYASAGRFFAHALRDIGEDNRSLPSPITVVEVLGRNVGWIAAATCFARHYEDDAPHLIYFPENRLSLDKLCAEAERVYRKLGRCVIAVCEGQVDDKGGWFGAEVNTAPGARDPLPANMGQVIARAIWAQLGVRARAEKPGLLGRSCATFASSVDRDESYRCGEAAVRAAIGGQSGQMVAIRRGHGAEYASAMALVPLREVAHNERPFPAEWMTVEKNDVTAAFRDWAAPLIGPVGAYARLEQVDAITNN